MNFKLISYEESKSFILEVILKSKRKPGSHKAYYYNTSDRIFDEEEIFKMAYYALSRKLSIKDIIILFTKIRVITVSKDNSVEPNAKSTGGSFPFNSAKGMLMTAYRLTENRIFLDALEYADSITTKDAVNRDAMFRGERFIGNQHSNDKSLSSQIIYSSGIKILKDFSDIVVLNEGMFMNKKTEFNTGYSGSYFYGLVNSYLNCRVNYDVSNLFVEPKSMNSNNPCWLFSNETDSVMHDIVLKIANPLYRRLGMIALMTVTDEFDDEFTEELLMHKSEIEEALSDGLAEDGSHSIYTMLCYDDMKDNLSRILKVSRLITPYILHYLALNMNNNPINRRSIYTYTRIAREIQETQSPEVLSRFLGDRRSHIWIYSVSGLRPDSINDYLESWKPSSAFIHPIIHESTEDRVICFDGLTKKEKAKYMGIIGDSEMTRELLKYKYSENK